MNILKNDCHLIGLKPTSRISILLSFLVLFTVFAGNIYAQQGVAVTGTVVDAAGESMPGVNVVIKGSTTGTVTDFNGKFNLQVPNSGSVLVFSFIGYVTYESVVGNQTTFNVTLQEDTKQLEEVVVVGYGTQKKVNLTGAVETVSNDRMVRQPVAQASQALMGLAPGLTVIQESGQPGKDGAKLRIRGIGSLGSSNDPLVLIDGVEGDINSLDMSDIENISVLKDASSAAIYGARASNGVVLVTTKRAKEGAVVVNYRNYFSWQNPTELPNYLGALDYLKYSGTSQADIDKYKAGMATDPYKYPDTDWVDLLFSENGFQQYHNISASGGSDKAKVIASLGYTGQSGNVVGFGFKRYNGRINSDLKIFEKFDINFDIAFNRMEQKASVYDLVYVMQDAFRLAPIYPYIYEDGSWANGFSGGNPIARVHSGGYNNKYVNAFKGTFRANYRPIEGMTLSAMYTPYVEDIYEKYASKTYDQIIDWEAKTINKINSPNQFKQTNTRPFTESFTATAAYTKTFGDHELSGLAGYEFVKYHYETFMAGRQDFVLQNYEVLNAGSEELDFNSGTATQNGLLSYFGRINYAFKNRYLFEANIRRDASSRFYSSNRVGVFPSFSAGWKMSEENFMKAVTVVSNLKLRASWGSLGNQTIEPSSPYLPAPQGKNPPPRDFPYASLIQMGKTNYMFGNKIASGAALVVMANKDIRWETTEVTNFGIDAGFLRQRLTFSFDYYIRYTKDILQDLPIPTDIGLQSPMQNIGNVKNRGWDFSLNWQDIAGDFKYGARFNLSDVKNEVTDLGPAKRIVNGNIISEVGHSIGEIYGFQTLGIFQTNPDPATTPGQFGQLKAGNLQYKDQITVDSDGDGIPDKADGKITTDDYVRIGNPFPRMTFGLDLYGTYKGFDVSVAIIGVGKRDVFLTGDLVLPLYNAGKIQEWHTKECWTPDRPDAKFPILAPTSVGGNDNQVSSTWVFNAAYWRVRNIVVGYTLPKQWTDKISIKTLRIYFSGQNLFTFDKLPEGIDPLMPNGAAGAVYPMMKNYTFGLDLSF